MTAALTTVTATAAAAALCVDLQAYKERDGPVWNVRSCICENEVYYPSSMSFPLGNHGRHVCTNTVVIEQSLGLTELQELHQHT